MRRTTSVTAPDGAEIVYRPSALVTAANAAPVTDTFTPAIASPLVAEVTRPVIWRSWPDAPAAPSATSARAKQEVRCATKPPRAVTRTNTPHMLRPVPHLRKKGPRA